MSVAFARADAVVTGMGAVCGACDASPFVKTRKLRKFMGPQDELAVTAAGLALQSSALRTPLGERCGLYIAVGYIPFEKEDIDRLLDASLEGEEFSMSRFAAHAFTAINPLLTFRVLPNMPAFHVSLNFDIQGPYVVTYPGAGQFYGVLDEALAALEAGTIDVALVAGAADQQNVLVEHHFSRVRPPVDPRRLVNASACLVIERAGDARARGAAIRARLLDYELKYAPVDPFAGAPPSECLARDGVCVGDGRELGPASLPFALAGTSASRLTHALRTRDGFTASSCWEVA